MWSRAWLLLKLVNNLKGVEEEDFHVIGLNVVICLKNIVSVSKRRDHYWSQRIPDLRNKNIVFISISSVFSSFVSECNFKINWNDNTLWGHGFSGGSLFVASFKIGNGGLVNWSLIDCFKTSDSPILKLVISVFYEVQIRRMFGSWNLLLFLRSFILFL